jgi:hypothetical protein
MHLPLRTVDHSAERRNAGVGFVESAETGNQDQGLEKNRGDKEYDSRPVRD